MKKITMLKNTTSCTYNIQLYKMDIVCNYKELYNKFKQV